MNAISEIYNCTHNILELEDVLPNVSFTATENVIITSKNGKYELTDELPKDVRPKKISKLRRIKV